MSVIYILLIEKVSDPFEMGGVELVKIELKGASFIYNQIRKMIGK